MLENSDIDVRNKKFVVKLTNFLICGTYSNLNSDWLLILFLFVSFYLHQNAILIK